MFLPTFRFNNKGLHLLMFYYNLFSSKMHLMRIIIYVTIITISQGQNTLFRISKILNNMINKEGLYNSYIDMFLFKYINNQTYESTSFQHIVTYFQYFSYEFKMVSKRKIPFKNLSIIKPASGHIHEWCEIKIGKCFKIGRRTFRQRDIHYHIDYKLSLNMTFIEINFNTIKWKKTCTSKASMLVIRSINKSKNDHKYCGFYSLFYFYSRFKNISIQIADFLNQEYSVNFLFAVIDSNFIYNVKWSYEQDHLSQLIPYHQYLIRKTYIVTSFLIRVQKMYRIIFKNNLLYKTDYVVFDGPSFLCNTIEAKNEIKVTSLFVCIIQFLQFFYKNNTYFSFSVKQLKSFNVLNIQNHSITFNIPNTKCTNNLCLTRFLTNPELQINLTVFHIVGGGKYKFQCPEGGILTMEYLNNKYMESVVLCEEHNGHKVPSRSFYSLNSSLILMLYWFGNKININVSTSISLTRCQPVYIDPCVYHLLICRSTLHAKDYLQNITQNTGLQLIPNDFITEYEFTNLILFDISNIECAVLQVGNKYPSYKQYFHVKEYYKSCPSVFDTVTLLMCKITLSPLKSGMTISSIKGLEGSPGLNIATYPGIKQSIIYEDLENVYKNLFKEYLISGSYSLVHVGTRLSAWTSRYWVDFQITRKHATSDAFVRRIPWYIKQYEVRNLLKFGPALYYAADLNLKIIQVICFQQALDW